MKPVLSPGAMSEDITVRLAGDGLSLSIGELLRERADALREITRLRIGLIAAQPAQSANFAAGGPEHLQPLGSLEMAPGSMLRLLDVCKVFSLSRSSVYTWIAQGRFPPPVQVGGRSVRWAADALMEWQRGLASATTKEAAAGRSCSIAAHEQR